MYKFCLFAVSILLFSCGENIKKKEFESPEVSLGTLYAEVSKARIFESDKIWADAIPVLSPKLIVKEYAESQKEPNFNLRFFVNQNFKFKLKDSINLKEENLKEAILKLIKKASNNQGSLIPTRKPYISGGGNFNEFSAYNSYFLYKVFEKMNRLDLCENLILNHLQFIQDYGHVPSGNRSYMLNDAPLPVLVFMIDDYTKKRPEKLTTYINLLTKEYQYWMASENTEEAENQKKYEKLGSYRSVVFMDSNNILNKYNTPNTEIRPHYYTEDLKLSNTDTAQLITNKMVELAHIGGQIRWRLPAGSQLLPIELNAVLYKIENLLASMYEKLGKPTYAFSFKNLANKRKEIFNKIFWKNNFYYDYDFVLKQTISLKTTAAVFPILCGLADENQEKTILEYLKTTIPKTKSGQDFNKKKEELTHEYFWSLLALEQAKNKIEAQKIKEYYLENLTKIINLTSNIRTDSAIALLIYTD